ncbi:hypothetical protein D1BOALGB6SA_10885 [Olavius sp. associated proteobacterium Delta 1]|nr:hypothetical protein D1BOALGB6SA_10885 [Olavius sp. associated proteobacterium Delta 1]
MGKGQQMDLDLIGPDNRRRSFELYWREESGPVAVKLKPETVELSDDHGLVWQGSIPDMIRAEHLQVIVSDPQGMGKVDVEARALNQWQLVAQNAAIYNTGNQTLADINIEPGNYRRFRFRFFGYDKRWRQTPLPIEKIVVSGTKLGRGYAVDYFTPEFKRETRQNVIEIKTILPGSGIWLEQIELTTQAQFQGTWTIGRETIVAGRKKFQAMHSGNVFAVNRDEKKLTVKIGRPWSGQSLIIQLDAGGRLIGKIHSLRVKARLPRLVFLADQPGAYTARTGLDKPAGILKFAGDRKRRIDRVLNFLPVEANMAWRPVDYVAEFAVMGGPFNMDGYTWKAPVQVSGPGLFRLVFNRQISMKPNPPGIRLVKAGRQVPFFEAEREVQKLAIEMDPAYNRESNRTTWLLKLPPIGPRWNAVVLSAKGIFDRQVVIETRNRGGRGWQPWQSRRWSSRAKMDSEFKIDMKQFPTDRSELRISMAHGDNQPIEINKIQALYPARSLIFLAAESGRYELMGGHPDASSPAYDLSLVQDVLIGIEPQRAEIGEVTVFKRAGFKTRLTRAFSDQTWGLYIVLALVTIVLLVIIAKLFPKAKQSV